MLFYFVCCVCQTYGVLHGGISAFLAESLGSLGAVIASGFQQVAGVEVSTSHLQPAPVGMEIEVKATPIHIGRRLQVRIKLDPSLSLMHINILHENKSQICIPCTLLETLIALLLLLSFPNPSSFVLSSCFSFSCFKNMTLNLCLYKNAHLHPLRDECTHNCTSSPQWCRLQVHIKLYPFLDSLSLMLINTVHKNKS